MRAGSRGASAPIACVEQRALVVERGLDVGGRELALLALLGFEHAVAPDAALLRRAVGPRLGEGQRALAVVVAVGEAAAVDVAVRQAQLALPVEAPVA